VNRFLHRIVNWLRVGYPQGIPPMDYMPLLALLSRRLTNDEVETVAKELMDRGEFDNVDIGVAITQITDDFALTRRRSEVRARLAAKGRPLDDPPDSEENR
jgi:hypothetical protein